MEPTYSGTKSSAFHLLSSLQVLASFLSLSGLCTAISLRTQRNLRDGDDNKIEHAIGILFILHCPQFNVNLEPNKEQERPTKISNSYTKRHPQPRTRAELPFSINPLSSELSIPRASISPLNHYPQSRSHFHFEFTKRSFNSSSISHHG